MAKSRTYNDALGQEVLGHFKGGKNAKELSALYGVTEQTIRNWKGRAQGHEQRAPIASRRSATMRESPEDLGILRLKKLELQAQLDVVNSMIGFNSET